MQRTGKKGEIRKKLNEVVRKDILNFLIETKEKKMLDCGVSRNTQIGLGGKVKFTKPTADR